MNGVVYLYDPYTGNYLGSLVDESYSETGEYEVGYLAWSSDGEYLAAVLSPDHFIANTVILVFNTTSREGKYRVNCGHGYPDTGASFLADNRLVWGGEGSLQIIDQEGEVESSKKMGVRITTLTTSPDHDKIIAGSWEGDIIIFTHGLEEVSREKRGVNMFSLSWQGNRIASVSSDSKITIWSTNLDGSITESRIISGWGNPVGYVDFYPDNTRVLSTHLSSENIAGSFESMGSIRSYEPDGSEVLRITPAPRSTGLSPGGRMIAACEQGVVNIYDAELGSLATRIYTNQDRYCRWNPSKPGLLALTGYGGLEIWNVTGTFEPVLTIPGTHYSVVDWADDGELVALATESSVEIWDLTLLSLLASTETWGGGILGLGISPDGTMLACASRKGTGDVPPDAYREVGNLVKITVWRFNRWGGGTKLKVIDELYLERMTRDPTTCLAWSPNSTLLAISTGTPGKIFTEPRTYDPSSNGVMILKESPNDLTGLVAVLNLTGPTRPVTSVEWSRDGSNIVAGCKDGTIRIWKVQTTNNGQIIIGTPLLYLLFAPALIIPLWITRLHHPKDKHTEKKTR
jgi:WD40 repeat protein